MALKKAWIQHQYLRQVKMNFSLLLFQPLIPLECNFIYIISLMHQDSYSFIAFSEKSNFKQAVLHQAKDFLSN